MLVFEFIGTKNKKDGWINFMIKEVIYENRLNQILEEEFDVIESASVIREEDIAKGDTQTAVQYELDFDKKVGKERRRCKPLVKIYTTMPGHLVDKVRSLVKTGEKATSAVDKTFFENPRIESDKKRRELTVLAIIFSMKPDGFKYLVIS